jgi:hypothetical protein
VTGEHLRHPECQRDSATIPPSFPVGKDSTNGSVPPRGIFLEQLRAPPFPVQSLRLLPDVLDRPVDVGGLRTPAARAQAIRCLYIRWSARAYNSNGGDAASTDADAWDMV